MEEQLSRNYLWVTVLTLKGIILVVDKLQKMLAVSQKNSYTQHGLFQEFIYFCSNNTFFLNDVLKCTHQPGCLRLELAADGQCV